MTTPLEVAVSLMDRLDKNDAEGVRRHFAPGAYWWVDTGWDRAAGDFSRDPGDMRPWPLHGRMDAQVKCDLLVGIRNRFPSGVRQTVRRCFAGGPFAVLEVEGNGLFEGLHPYRNRYCFVIEVHDGAVTSVREYLDTALSAAVFRGRNLDRRSVSAQWLEPVTAPKTKGSQSALRFLDMLNAADGEGLLSMSASDATWWGDGGPTRTQGPEAAPDLDTDVSFVGRVPLSLKAPRVSQLHDTFPGGLRLHAHRLVEDDAFERSGLVALEVAGHGARPDGTRYQNRYVFTLAFEKDGQLREVREYCDTRHAFDVFGVER